MNFACKPRLKLKQQGIPQHSPGHIRSRSQLHSAAAHRHRPGQTPAEPQLKPHRGAGTGIVGRTCVCGCAERSSRDIGDVVGVVYHVLVNRQRVAGDTPHRRHDLTSLLRQRRTTSTAAASPERPHSPPLSPTTVLQPTPPSPPSRISKHRSPIASEQRQKLLERYVAAASRPTHRKTRL